MLRIALSVLVFLIALAALALLQWLMVPSEVAPSLPPAAVTTPESRLDADGRAWVDRWLAENGLNEFGDPPGTFYPGGTPLFDERTVDLRERYEHVLLRHPQLTDGLASDLDPEVVEHIDTWLEVHGLDSLGRAFDDLAPTSSALIDPVSGALLARPHVVLEHFPEIRSPGDRETAEPSGPQTPVLPGEPCEEEELAELDESSEDAP